LIRLASLLRQGAREDKSLMLLFVGILELLDRSSSTHPVTPEHVAHQSGFGAASYCI